MSNSIYHINKGINKSIEFHGLRAQYIWYFGGLVLLLMIVFAVLYTLGAGTVICFAVTGSSGAYISLRLFAMSRKYGEHGLMKAMAKKKVPGALRSYSRKSFQHFSDKEDSK